MEDLARPTARRPSPPADAPDGRVARLLAPVERVRRSARPHPVALARPLAVRAAQLLALHLLVVASRSSWVDWALANTPFIADAGPDGGPFPLARHVGRIAFWLALTVLALALRDVGRWWRTRFVLTDQRVITSGGLLVSALLETPLDRIDEVLVVQGPLGSRLGYGHLVLLRGAEEGHRLGFLPGPVAFEQAMHAARERRLHALRFGGAQRPFPAPREEPGRL